MVHALIEAYRILAPHGVLIDVRPLSLDVPLEIIYKGGCDSAGLIDMSPDLELDIAADQAIERVLNDNLFTEVSKEFFDFPYFWKTMKDFLEDIQEFWKDGVNVSDKVLQQAREYIMIRRPQTQIRVRVQMKLVKYEKQT
jgi:hypothetical protein